MADKSALPMMGWPLDSSGHPDSAESQEHPTTNLAKDIGKESYVPQPLQEPAHWIRLLRFESEQDSEALATTVSTWERAGAPSFIAVSYTWGDKTLERSITVDGKTLMVRHNCLFALQQARSYDPESYVWIDSICINQRDLHEKRLQVQMMYALYRQAATVLACIGPSADESEAVIELGKRLETLEYSSAIDLPKDRLEVMEAIVKRLGCRASNTRLKWVLSQDEEQILRFHRSMRLLSQREYWKRVWVVQEVASARRVVVLCGYESLSWEGLVRVRDTLQGMSDTSRELEKLDTSAIRNLRMAATRHIRSLQSFVSHFRESKCADARDRLFAFSTLIEWSAFGPVTVDYTKSAFQLLVELAERQFVSEDLLAALEVSAIDVNMKAAVRRRQQPSKPTEGAVADQAAPIIRNRPQGTNRMGKLEVKPSGQLTMKTERTLGSGMQAETETSSMVAHLKDISERPAEHQLEWAERMPKEIKDAEGNMIGWACSEARPGDLLLPCNENLIVVSTSTPYLLVLRKSAGDLFDIIGQALLLADFQLPWHGRGYVAPGEAAPKVDGYSVVELYLSAEDKVVLTGQDLAAGSTHDKHARVERLFTSVTANAKSAARITFHEYTRIEMMNIGASPDLQPSRSTTG